MRRVYIQPAWKDTWKYCYTYDLLEIYGETKQNIGYSYSYELRKNNTLALIQSVVPQGGNILDVAAAQGNFSLKLAELGYNVTWNDIREDLAEYVEMKKEFGKVEYKPGNAFEVKFDQLFDLVLATEIIEHVAHPDEFLASLAKLVKPGGHIVISTPLGSYFNNKLPKFTKFEDASVFEAKQFGPNEDDHIFLLHLDEIPVLAQRSGLQIMAVNYYANPLTCGHIKLSPLLKVLPKSVVMNLERFTQKLPQNIGRRIHHNFAVLFKKEAGYTF